MSALDFEDQVAVTMAAIERSESIHPDNKERLKEWKRDLSLSGLSDATIQKRLAHMKVVAEHLEDTEFSELTKPEMKNLVEWIQSRETAKSTKEGYKKIIRFFWKWLLNTEDNTSTDEADYPAVVRWIDVDSRASTNTLPQDLLTKDEVEQQIAAASNARDKALIAMLYETGARIGELLDLTVGDIEDRQNGRKVVVDGKTGPRRIPLKESVPYLNNWLAVHPTGQKSDPLWSKLRVTETTNDAGDVIGRELEAITYNYVRQKILQKTADQAGIEKPVNPHHYRHSRASYLANHFKEAQLCEWFGWVQGSDIPSKYVHLSGRDLDEAYDAMQGESQPSGKVDTPNVRECDRCEEENAPDAKFCNRCGYELDRNLEDVQSDIPVDEVDNYLTEMFSGMLDGFAEEAGVDLDIDPDDLLEEVRAQRMAGADRPTASPASDS